MEEDPAGAARRFLSCSSKNCQEWMVQRISDSVRSAKGVQGPEPSDSERGRGLAAKECLAASPSHPLAAVRTVFAEMTHFATTLNLQQERQKPQTLNPNTLNP